MFIPWATTPWLALPLLAQLLLKRHLRLDFKRIRKINKISGVGYPAPDFWLKWVFVLLLSSDFLFILVEGGGQVE